MAAGEPTGCDAIGSVVPLGGTSCWFESNHPDSWMGGEVACVQWSIF